MALTPQDWKRISGLALIVGPIQFALATLIEGALIPGYGLITHWVSDLGAPPNNAPHFAPGTQLWWVFSVSLILMALLVFVGLVGLYPNLRATRLGKSVAVLMAIVALGAIGVAVWNEVDALELHSISALTAFGIGWLAMVLFALDVRKNPNWTRAWSPLTLVGGLVSLRRTGTVCGSHVRRSDKRSQLGRRNLPGGSERLILLPIVLWLIALGTHLVRQTRHEVVSPAPSNQPS